LQIERHFPRPSNPTTYKAGYVLRLRHCKCPVTAGTRGTLVTYHHGMRTFRRLSVAALLGLAIGLAVIPIVIAEGSLHIANRPAAEPGAADYLARVYDAPWRPASITAPDSVKLAGWFFVPTESNGGAVMLLHGVGDTRLGMTGHAEYLLHTGYAVLLPDSRGHGESGGSLITYGLKEARDTAQWARWMAAQPGIDRTYALGESMGASILIQSLALHPGFRAIVAECPFARFSEVAVYRVSQRLFGALSPVARPIVWAASLYARTRYGMDVMQASPADALRNSTTPVLLIHGTADTNIPPQQSRELHALNPQTTELWEVPGAGHVSAMTAEPQAYQRRVRAWFAGH
jgi:dipeptidyl aminopeptidase/acylaminoacyl peptidase